MIISEVQGDLVATLKSSIESPKYNRLFLMGQGCNCFVRQGAGIAGQLRVFPQVFQADVDYGEVGDVMKLGKFSTATIDDKSRVFNMYTQYSMGSKERHVEYSAIIESIRAVCDSIKNLDEILYLPLIGAGLAGGDWNIIRDIIDKASESQKVVIVHYKGGVIIDW